MPREKRRLTRKEAAFVDHYARHGNGSEAVMASYDAAHGGSAKVIASRLMDKPMIVAAVEERRKTLRQALIDGGITEDTIAEKVGELLDASTPEGEPDYGAVDKGIKHALTIFGVVSPEDQPRTVNVYNFMFSAEGRARISAVEAEIRAALTSRPAKKTDGEHFQEAEDGVEAERSPGGGVHTDGESAGGEAVGA